VNHAEPRADHANAKRLDRATIVRAGLDVAARPNSAAISIRALGAELGVDPTAVYRHFRAKDDLMKALLDAVQAIALERIAGVDADWRERLRLLSRATLDAFVDHPAIAIEATVLTTNGPAELTTIEFILGAFSEAGLSGADLVRHYALFASYVLSEAAGIARGRTTTSGDADDAGGTPSNAWFDGPLLVDPVTHSNIASVAAELKALRDEDIFYLGIEVILDSAERAANA
jgi:AcrR family transcriptional regulator